MPMPIVFPSTAEHDGPYSEDGRYSEGSHTQFFELYVIHSPSELKAQPSYRGLCGSVTLGALFDKDDDASRAILPISV